MRLVPITEELNMYLARVREAKSRDLTGVGRASAVAVPGAVHTGPGLNGAEARDLVIWSCFKLAGTPLDKVSHLTGSNMLELQQHL